MNLFSMVLFHKLFSIYNECSKKYEVDSPEYKKCKKLKNFNDKLFQEFLEQNQKLLEEYLNMLKSFENQKFIMQMYIIQKKIDDEIEEYLTLEEQMEFLKEFFDIEILINDFEMDR